MKLKGYNENYKRVLGNNTVRLSWMSYKCWRKDVYSKWSWFICLMNHKGITCDFVQLTLFGLNLAVAYKKK